MAAFANKIQILPCCLYFFFNLQSLPVTSVNLECYQPHGAHVVYLQPTPWSQTTAPPLPKDRFKRSKGDQPKPFRTTFLMPTSRTMWDKWAPRDKLDKLKRTNSVNLPRDSRNSLKRRPHCINYNYIYIYIYIYVYIIYIIYIVVFVGGKLLVVPKSPRPVTATELLLKLLTYAADSPRFKMKPMIFHWYECQPWIDKPWFLN